MRISTMPMFLGCGLAAFVLGGGPTFATEITIHDSPGRDYVITVDPSSDKPTADPAPQGKQNARRIKITTVDKEKGKELPKAMLGPYNVAVSEGAKGDGTNPDKGTWHWRGGFSITVKSPEGIPTTGKEGRGPAELRGDVGRRRQGGPRRPASVADAPKRSSPGRTAKAREGTRESL